MYFLLSSIHPSSSTKQPNKRYKSSNKIYLTTRAPPFSRERSKRNINIRATTIPPQTPWTIVETETLVRYPCARDRISALPLPPPQGTRYIPRKRIESGRKCRTWASVRLQKDPEGPVARTGRRERARLAVRNKWPGAQQANAIKPRGRGSRWRSRWKGDREGQREEKMGGGGIAGVVDAEYIYPFVNSGLMLARRGARRKERRVLSADNGVTRMFRAKFS